MKLMMGQAEKVRRLTLIIFCVREGLLQKLHFQSVNSAPGKTLTELTVTIPNQQVGVTTAGEAGAAGGHVLPKPTARNPDHCVMEALTPEEAARLFTPTVCNPHR